MKILAINDSPKSNGNTAATMQTVLEELMRKNIETKIVAVGQKAIRG